MINKFRLYGLLGKIRRNPRHVWNSWRNRLKNDKKYFRVPQLTSKPANLIIVIGAESTATRFISKVLATHSSIIGEKAPEKHRDLFDEVWQALEIRKDKVPIKLMPKVKTGKIYLTRRSIPHSLFPGKPATYFEFPPLKEFLELAKMCGFVPIVFVTVRSPIPNLMSWKRNRASGGESLERCLRQYQAVYPFIFYAITETSSQFFILSEEALVSDRGFFLRSLFYLLGLNPPDDLPTIKGDVNIKYYEEYEKIRGKIVIDEGQ